MKTEQPVEEKKGAKILAWIKAAGIRALKTVAQTAVAIIGTATIMGAVDWVMVGSASLLSGILSLLTSLAGLPELKPPADEPIVKPLPPKDDDETAKPKR